MRSKYGYCMSMADCQGRGCWVVGFVVLFQGDIACDCKPFCMYFKRVMLCLSELGFIAACLHIIVLHT
jgi:hypothetical protein